MWWRGNVSGFKRTFERGLSFFNRNNLFLTVVCVLPLVAYIAGSIVYYRVDLEGINVSKPASIFPVFSALFDLTVQTFGVNEGRRFYLISSFLLVTYLIQNIMIAVLALTDSANMGIPRQRWQFGEIVSITVFLSVFYLLFFDTDFAMNLTSRSAPTFYFTDFKFFIIGGTFGLSLMISYKFIFFFGRILFSLIDRIDKG